MEHVVARRRSAAASCSRHARALAACCAILCFAALLAPAAYADPTASIELSPAHPQDNVAFSVSNMMPGDTETLRSAVTVTHDANVDVVFTAVLNAETQRLSEALLARITDRDTGAVLFDATLAELVNGGPITVPLQRSAGGTSAINWLFEVRAPTSMTNEHQRATCELTLDWAVAYEDAPAPMPPQPGAPGGGILDNLPATGDLVMIGLIILFCACAVICMRAAAAESDEAMAARLPLLAPAAAEREDAGADGDAPATPGHLGRLLDYLKHHRRVCAALLAIVFLLLAIATAWALFWAHATIPGNRFEMGSIAVDLNEGRPILPANGVELEPGRTVVRDFTVSNTGSAACFYRLHLSRLTGDLAGALHVTISRPADGAVLYDGSAIGLERTALCESPTVLEPGATDTLTLTVKMAEGSGNEYQGGAVTFDVTLTAVQAKNNEGREFS